MRNVLKKIGGVLAGLILLLIIAVLGLMIAGTVRLNQTHDVEVSTINIPTDETALARGAHLVDVFCTGCHGDDLLGLPVIDDPALGVISATNITGAADRYSDETLIRSIRHGIGSEGSYLMLMPVDSHIYFSKEDLGAIIAYLKTIPQSGTVQQTRQLRPIGRILVGVGALDELFPATAIDHSLPFPEMPEVGLNAPYGEYLARHCRGCHGLALTGGTHPDPDSPPAPNITPNSVLGSYTEAGFITTLQTGVTPYSRELRSEYMPWPSYAKLDNSELQALWLYLSSLDS